MQFSNQKILIISPEPWGVNMLSKHHYAVALAKRNNIVFFLNPPSSQFLAISNDPISNVSIVDYSPSIKGLNRILFRFPFLADLICRYQIKKLLKFIPQPDIVWSFDPYRFQNLKHFGARLSIFHPVDFFNSRLDLLCAKSADIIFSVAPPILNKYRNIGTPAFFINHGVSEPYLVARPIKEKNKSVIRCGYVGNLLSPYIHHENLHRIVTSNPTVEFNFIGPVKKNNLGSKDEPENPIHRLSKLQNTVFHGELPPEKVAEIINTYDIFLICYAVEKVGNIASNSHKILEYLSTGKVVVSSRISTYDNTASELFEMVSTSDELSVRFTKVVSNLAEYNSKELQDRRILFTDQNSYVYQIQAIEKLVNENLKFIN